jgi:hypothetical protein
MPIARFQMPDGRIARFEVPDGTTPEQAMAAMQAHFKPREAPPIAGGVDPTSDMGTVERTLAGIGKGMTDLARGAGQRLGLVDQASIDASKRHDAALMNTTAGSAGNIAGKVVAGLPAVFVPGANTLVGAAAVGGAQGLLEPTATGESVAGNVALGAAGGAAGVVAGRAIRAGVHGGRALMEPFTRAGQERIAGRTLQRFAENPNALAGATSARTATGAMPTLAEATRDRGIATLERSLGQQDPQIAARFAQRGVENNAARMGVLEDLAGTDGARTFAAANRDATASQLYKQAQDVGLNPLTSGRKGEITQLLKRPAMQQAIKEAKRLAQNEGVNIGNPAGSVKGLDYVKRALDDQIAGAMGNEKRILTALKDRLLTTVDDLSPEYAAARNVYADMSRPINQMDIGQRLLDKTTSATRDMAGNQRLQANSFARALNDEQALIRGATGFRGNRELTDVLEPQQIASLNAIREELELAANLANAANGPGSQTAKSLASQNLLRQTLGPTGMPQSWSENALLQTAMRPVQWGMQVAEPRIQNALADILLDPQRARQALQAATPAQRNALLQALGPYLQQAGQQSVPAALVSGQR